VTKDDTEERTARARRLRKSIDAAETGKQTGPPAAPESPREFVQRRMAEMTKVKKK
jgi:hypothetical protein